MTISTIDVVVVCNEGIWRGRKHRHVVLERVASEILVRLTARAKTPQSLTKQDSNRSPFKN